MKKLIVVIAILFSSKVTAQDIIGCSDESQISLQGLYTESCFLFRCIPSETVTGDHIVLVDDGSAFTDSFYAWDGVASGPGTFTAFIPSRGTITIRVASVVSLEFSNQFGGNPLASDYCKTDGAFTLNLVTQSSGFNISPGTITVSNGIFGGPPIPSGFLTRLNPTFAQYRVNPQALEGLAIFIVVFSGQQDVLGCVGSTTETVTFFSPDPQDANFIQDPLVVCVDDEPVNLFSNVDITNGTWSGIGVTNNQFSPGTAGVGTANLTYSFTDNEGCRANKPLEVVINAIPNASAGPDRDICPGGSISLAGSGGGTYSWSPSSTLSSANIANPVASPTTTTVYTLTVTDGNGCNRTDNVTVTVNPLPVANAGSNKIICQGEGVLLDGQASGGSLSGYSYSWTPVTDLSDPLIANPIASPASGRTYTLRVTDGAGCISTDQVEVIVNDNPTILLTADGIITNEVSVCDGDAVELRATGGETYLWSPSEGLNNPFISNPIATPSSTTVYTVNVVNRDGCQSSAQMTVNVLTVATIEAGPTLFLCEDDAPYDLRQDVNLLGGAFSGSGTDGVFFDPSRVSPNVYTITYAITTGGCLGTDTREVQVFGAPNVSVSPDAEICLNSGTPLLASGGSAYQWFPSTGLSADDIPNPIANPTSTTDYTVRITNANNCSSEEHVTVTVQRPNANAGTNAFICRGENTSLSASGGVNYLWQPATGLNDDGVRDPIASPIVTTTYKVTVTDGDGCQGKDEVTVFVTDLTAVDAGPPLLLCQGDAPYDLRDDVSITGGTFSGSAVDGVLVRPAELEPNIYFITYTVEENGCNNSDQREVEIIASPEITVLQTSVEICLGEEVGLLASGGVSYQWSPTTWLDDANIANPTAAPTTSTLYTVTTTNANNCTSEATVLVNVSEASVSAGLDVSLCVGNSTQLNATGGIQYAWSPTVGLSNPNISNPIARPTATRTYTVTITDGDGCQGTDDVTVTVNTAPSISAGTPLELCENSPAYDLRQDVSIPGGTFTGPGVDGVLFRASSITPSIYFITYTAQVADCQVTAFREIRVNDIPTVGVSSTSEVICPGGSIALSAFGGEFYEWTPADGLSDPMVANPIAAPETTTLYTVTAINGTNCSSSTTVLVSIDQPTVNAGSDFDLCINAPPITLQAPVEGGTWEGSGIVNGVLDPLSFGLGDLVATYSLPNENGCLAQDSIIVTILPEPVLVVGDPLQLCTTDNPVDLLPDVNLRGGVFEGNGMTGSVFDPGEGADTYIITYTVRFNGCELQAFREIQVNDATPVDFGENIELCENADPYNLAQDLNILGGEITGEGVIDGFFHAQDVATGNYLITYKFTNAFGCLSTATKIINVVGALVVDAGADQTVCNTVNAFDLSGFGNPKGGFFTGANVTENVFNASGLSAGDYFIDYVFDNGNGCVSVDALRIQVFESPIRDFGVDTIVCVSNEPILLNFNDLLATGEWSGAGVIENNFFSALAGEGQHVLTYRNSSVDCDAVGTRTITVVGKPGFAISALNEVSACEGDFVELTASLPDSEVNQNTRVGWFAAEEATPFALGNVVNYQVEHDGRIFYKSISQFGCFSDQESFISITTDNPSGEIAVSDPTPAFGRPVRFFAEGVRNTSAFEWDFGDGLVSYERDPWHFYYTSDTFSIRLTLTSSSGCETEIVEEDFVVVGKQRGDGGDSGVVTGLGSGVTPSALWAPPRGEDMPALEVIRVYPMPVEDRLTLEVNTSGFGRYGLRLVDVFGVSHPLEDVYLKRGVNRVEVDLVDIEVGSYVLVIEGDRGLIRVKVVVF